MSAVINVEMLATWLTAIVAGAWFIITEFKAHCWFIVKEVKNGTWKIIKVVLSEQAEADIIREVLDSDVCQMFTKKEPFYMLLFVQILELCFNNIRERSRIQQVADIIKGDNTDD